MGALQCCRNREELEDPNETNDNKEEPANIIEQNLVSNHATNNHSTNNTLFSNQPWVDYYNEIQGKFFIQIQIALMSLKERNYDKYGCVFQPFVEFVLGKEKKQLMSLNNSDNVTISNTVTPVLYRFNSVVNFECGKSQFYSMLNINVKNIIWTSINKKQSVNNENAAVIGGAEIPINLIPSFFKQSEEDENEYKGEMILYQNEYKEIGSIFLVIKLSDKPSDLSMTEKKLLNRNNISTPNGESFKTYSNILIHYHMFSESALNKIFDSPSLEQIEGVKSFLTKSSKSDVVDSKSIVKTFYDFIANNSTLLGYELFIHLYDLSSKYENIQQIDMTLFDMKEELILQLPEKMEYNVYFLKIFFMFLHNYINGIKSLDNATDTQIKEKSLTKLLNETAENIKKIKEKNKFEEETELLYQEMIQWIFNVIIDLITFPKNYKNFLYESRVKEAYKTFETSKSIFNYISIYYYFIKEYLNNSQIVLVFIRMLRKIIQITCTNDDIKEYQKQTNFDVYEFKKFLIYDSNGLFISLISKVIETYQHYPEIISNVLQIFVIVTKGIKDEDLNYFIVKLKLPSFTHCIYYYIGKYYQIFKEINQLYLEFLDNESEMAKSQEFEDIFTKVENERKIEELGGINIKYENEMLQIANELICFLETNNLNGKEKELFSNLPNNLYDLNLISSISQKITLYPKIAFILLQKDEKTNLNFFYNQFKIITTFAQYGSSSLISGGDLITKIMTVNSQTFTPNQIKIIIQEMNEHILTMIYQCLTIDETAQGVYDILDGKNYDKYELSNHYEISNKLDSDKQEDNVLSDLVNYFHAKDIKINEIKKIKMFYDNMINDKADSVSDD